MTSARPVQCSTNSASNVIGSYFFNIVCSWDIGKVLCYLNVRVRFLRARVTLGLNSPRMRIKKRKEHGVLSWKITCLSSDFICLLLE